jgi:hypothetical protein
VGGRVRTDVIDGYRCDRGFQLINPALSGTRKGGQYRSLICEPSRPEGCRARLQR